MIFWGYTGTGKSTSIIALNGQELYAYNKFGTAVLTNNVNQDIQTQIKSL